MSRFLSTAQIGREVFNFNKVQLSSYLHGSLLVLPLKCHHPTQVHLDCFFVVVVIVYEFCSLYFTFRSMVHFELIFVKGVDFFFPCGCPIISAPFVEKTILSLAIELPLLHYQRSADCLYVSISGFSILFH